MIDFRLPQNRKEGFIRYAVWQLRTGDCDTALPVMNYIFDRQEFNIEQKYWFCYLYGNTYDAASALAIWNEMPDHENIDLNHLKIFNTEKFKLLSYQTDCKWSKGHLDKMTESYVNIVKQHGTQDKFFKAICNSHDPKINYENLKNVIIDKFYKFGRYCTFFYMQSLKECCGLNIEPTSMLYGPDSESHTNGACYLFNKEDWLTRYYTDDGNTKNKRSVKYTKDMINYLQSETDLLITEIKTRFPDVKPDYFNMETMLCSYKKLWRRSRGRYLGYYHNRLMEDVLKSEKNFPGVDYNIIKDWFEEGIPSYCYKRVGPSNNATKMSEFLDTGNFTELELYQELANVE